MVGTGVGPAAPETRGVLMGTGDGAGAAAVAVMGPGTAVATRAAVATGGVVTSGVELCDDVAA